MKNSLFDRLKSQKTPLSTSIDENSKNIKKVQINIKGLSKMPPQLDMKSVRVLVERTKFNVMFNLEFQQKNNRIPKTPLPAVVRAEEGEKTPLKDETVKKAAPLASSTPQPAQKHQQLHHNQQQKKVANSKAKTQRQPSIDGLFKTRKCCVKIAKVKVLLKLLINEGKKQQHKDKKEQQQHKDKKEQQQHKDKKEQQQQHKDKKEQRLEDHYEQHQQEYYKALDSVISVPGKIPKLKLRKQSNEGIESPKTPQQTAVKPQKQQQIEVKELPKTKQTSGKLQKQPIENKKPPKPTPIPIPIQIEKENEPSPMIVEAPIEPTPQEEQPVEHEEPQIIEKPQADPIEEDNDHPMSPQTPAANPQQPEQEQERPQIEVIVVPSSSSSKPQTPGQKRKSSEKSPSSSPPKRKAKKGNEFFIKIGALTRTNSPRRRAVTTLNSSIVDNDKPLSPRPRTPLTSSSTNINKQQQQQPESESEPQQPQQKRKPAKKVEKKVLSASGIATLRHKFGSRYFKSFVKIKRMNTHISELQPTGSATASSSPPKTDEPKKKKNGKNLSVSFLETVEIFGESSDDDDWFDMDPKKAKPPIINTDSIFNSLKTSTPCGPDIRNSTSISSSASVSASASSNNSSSGILKSSILDRKEKSSFSPLKEHESPRKEQLKLANESFVPRSLETQIAEEEEREVAEDLEKESDKASSPVPDNDIADDVRPNSRESSPKPSDSTNESIVNNPPSADDEDESLKNSSKNSNEIISPAEPLDNIADADTEDDDDEDQEEDEEEESFKTTRCEDTFEEPQGSVNETAESNTNLHSCNDEEDEDEEEPQKFVENTEENTMNPETSLDDTNDDEEPKNQEQDEEANEDETHEDEPNEDDDGANEDEARQNDVNDDQAYEEDETNADHQTNEDNHGNEDHQTNNEQHHANLDNANQDIISKDDTCPDDGDEEPFLDPTALVASVLINRSPHPEDQRQEAVAVLNDACQIGADESNGVLITPTGHLSYHSPHNSVVDDDDDFNTVLRHPEAEKTLLSTASAGLVPNSQEIIVAAAAVAQQATMVAPPDVDVTEDTFASVVAEVERLTKDVNSAIYSADVGITGADVMMDNVQARHSLDDIFDDDVDDDIISSLRMSSGSIDIGHDKSLPIQIIETEVMGIPNEPDLIFDKPLGTTPSILSSTQMNSAANDTLAGHGTGGGGGGGGHTSSTESSSNTKLLGRLFQSVKSYVMSPGSPRKND